MNKYIGLSIVALGLTFTSCNDFLDTTPDNRATIDSEEKVEKLLVSAYSTASYVYFCEAMSDNFDDYGEANPNTDRFVDEVYAWKDVTEDDNESPERYWTGAYDAIIQANQALEAIGNVGNSRNMQEARAEALLSRAYHHFMLVNIFAKNYNSATSDTDPGVPYLGGVEDKLDVHHERASVATVYQMIDRDLQEALPLVGSDYMSVPKYHFNPKAAYAFAARFYLFYEKWDQALKYANLCLGANAASQIRNWQAWSQVGTDREVQFNDWIDASNNANLLLNIGPRPDGKLPQESLDRLKAIGKWLRANGESIYGTRGGVVTPRDWGVTTQKGKTLYVHILNLQDASLFLPVENVKRAVMFADMSPVKVTRCPGGVTLSFSAIPSGVDTIVEVSLK